MCLCGVRGVIVGSGLLGWCAGWVGDLGKLYYLVAPFEICGFQRGVNFVSKFILKERSA